MNLRFMLAALAAVAAQPVSAQSVTQIDRSAVKLTPLPTATPGRVQPRSDGRLSRQWPGTYFETAFVGPHAFFEVGPGEVSLRVSVDGRAPVPLVKPAPGIYRVSKLGKGRHRLRVDVASETQGGATIFGGFYAGAGTRPAPLRRRTRAMEFIGDSHTVGYGNTSSTRECTNAEVWAKTDTSLGLAAIAARHYDADYQVNAISGRGVVRNYNGFAGDTLPQVYPFALFDKAQPARDPAWRPQVIAVSLGTNDFSTPLNKGERWRSRDELRADYEASYVRFVKQLRERNPNAYVLLWVADVGNAELSSAVSSVADKLRRAGDARIGFVPVAGLSMSGCNYHPNLDDDRKIAASITRHLDARPDAWKPARR